MFRILDALASLDEIKDDQSAKVFSDNWPYTKEEALKLIRLQRETQRQITKFKAA